MITSYNHVQMGVVGPDGNVKVLYPNTTGSDVSITPNKNDTATNIQDLASNLGSMAFQNKDAYKNIHDGYVKTWNDDGIQIPIYSYTRNNIGVFVSFTFKLLHEITGMQDTPLVTIYRPDDKEFCKDCYGPTMNCKGLIYQHDTYDFALMLRNFEDLKTTEEYYGTIMLPFI